MRTVNNKFKLYALLAVFIAPVVISWVLYHQHNSLHLATLNHGTLVQPVLPAAALTRDKNWQILYLPNKCNNDATDHELFMLHQLRRVLGKDGERVSLVAAARKGCDFGDTHDFQRLLLTNAQYKELKKTLKLKQVDDKIYLLDPQGNLFMYYSSNTDNMNILKDLKRVLEVSQIG